MKRKLLLGMIIISAILNSCANSKDVVYFQGDAELNTLYNNNIPTIQPGDKLNINITAADPRAVTPFNQIGDQDLKTAGGGATQFKIYTVNQEGLVEFPIIGNLKLANLTLEDASELLKSKLTEYVNDPGVIIKFNSFRISVIGEVTRPGTFVLDNERVSILEAIAMAGDLSIQGKRDNVMVIREFDGKKQTYSVDLTKKESLDSPAFYLKQNDVVYVEPNKSRVQASIFNVTTFISIASLALALITLLTRF